MKKAGPEIILYPTETVYTLGVNPFDEEALSALYELKQKNDSLTMSWLVRNIKDIEKYANVTPTAREIISLYLPGPLTIALEAKSTVPEHLRAEDGTISFRISSDKKAQQLIAEYMKEHGVPLTCTSANIYGHKTHKEVLEIIEQFGGAAKMITKVIDDGPRTEEPSTVVRVIGLSVTVLREGQIVI